MTANGTLRVVVARTGRPLALAARMARGVVARAVGLLGRRALQEGEALVFERCNSIHTVGMRFPIDAVFVDRSWRVVALRPGLVPGRVVLPVSGAWGVLELASGTVQQSGLQEGDQLDLLEANHV